MAVSQDWYFSVESSSQDLQVAGIPGLSIALRTGWIPFSSQCGHLNIAFSPSIVLKQKAPRCEAFNSYFIYMQLCFFLNLLNPTKPAITEPKSQTAAGRGTALTLTPAKA